MNSASPRCGRMGFTLVEVLVSMSVLILVMLVLVSITDSTQRTWSYTNGKIEQFREAREAFEALTRQISQATLNTYWDYERDNQGKPLTAVGTNSYVRQSELRFLCGSAPALTQTADCPGHAVFFQAPLGFSNDALCLNLENLLNTWGYYIQFGDDPTPLPPFFSAISRGKPASRYRFRLMEMMEPSERLSLYSYTSGSAGMSYTGTQWFRDPLASGSNSRVLAENIVALVLLPKLSQQEDATGAKLAPQYTYDSTTTGAAAALSGTAAAAVNSKNQLPPIIQVTMVAVDEASYSRFQKDAALPASLGLDTLFKDVGDATNAANPGFARDLKTLTDTLQAHKINYRVFTTNIAIKAAKWSREQIQ